ncbi:MAG: carbon-nitrogen hydrolase family protein [Euryarchaeota archaeon]|nr:carbon-nitrogen hydrolase family protein [Euryarchaeota archaeon]
MPALRAALLQVPVWDTLEANLEAAGEMAARAARMGAHLAVLPEYWFGFPYAHPVFRFEALTRGRVLDFYRRTSEEHGLLLSGNLTEASGGHYYNVGLWVRGDRVLSRQRKLHPTPNERAWGVSPGSRVAWATERGTRLATLVCADVLWPETCARLRGADIVSNPVVSRRRDKDGGREARNAMFVARAFDNGYYLLKAGGVSPRWPIAGRSLAAAPWGLLARARGDTRPELLRVDLDLERLRRARRDIQGLRGEAGREPWRL